MYCTGWTIPHIREDLDLPTLEALRRQWARFPPLPVMVAHYLGAAKPKTHAAPVASLEDQDLIPSKTLSRSEFDELLRTMKLPVPPAAPPEATA